MKFIKKNGETSVIVRIFIQDSSLTTGAGLTGLTNGSTGLRISVAADNQNFATSYTSAAGDIETVATTGTWAAPTSGKIRFKEFQSTGFPGVYEIQFDNALFAVSGCKSVMGMVIGVTNMAPTPFEIQLDAGEVIADQLLGRNVNGGSNTGRLVKQALHFLRNKWTVIAGVLTVYDTDDSTVSWTATVSSDAAAPPITGSDPS